MIRSKKGDYARETPIIIVILLIAAIISGYMLYNYAVKPQKDIDVQLESAKDHDNDEIPNIVDICDNIPNFGNIMGEKETSYGCPTPFDLKKRGEAILLCPKEDEVKKAEDNDENIVQYYLYDKDIIAVIDSDSTEELCKINKQFVVQEAFYPGSDGKRVVSDKRIEEITGVTDVDSIDMDKIEEYIKRMTRPEIVGILKQRSKYCQSILGRKSAEETWCPI